MFSCVLCVWCSVTWFPQVLLSVGGDDSMRVGVAVGHQTRQALWSLLVGLPACCVAVQLWLWRVWFTLQGDYLKRVKVHNGTE